MNELQIYNKIGKLYNFNVVLSITIILGFINLISVHSFIGIVITFFEILWVISLYINKRYDDALIWHFIFIVLSISAQGAAGNGGQHPLYNYAELKLVGPIRCSYVLTILFYVLSKKKIKNYTNNILGKTLKIFLIIAVSGDIIGLTGFFFKKYYNLQSFIYYNVYIWMVIFTIYTLFKYNTSYISFIIWKISIPLLCGSVIASSIGFLIGIRTDYGAMEGLPLTLDIVYYAPILIISLAFIKRKFIFVSICTLMLIYLSFKSMGGKSVFIFSFAFILLIYFIFLSNHKHVKLNKRYNSVKILIIILGIIISIKLPTILADGQSMTGYKIASAISIFSGNIDQVQRSPATRIGETANIFYNNRNNPFHLLFGNGYGGYFTDELGMFIGLDVARGGWPEEIVKTGRYPTAHDTFAAVPLLNGIIGLILIFYISFIYIKRIKTNYLNFAIVPWVLLTFYFSTLIAFIGIFFICGGQFNLST